MTNGCHNTERKPYYFAPDREYNDDDGTYVEYVRTIYDNSSKECRYDMRVKDPKCEGCRK
jgi:hypothetical protein